MEFWFKASWRVQVSLSRSRKAHGWCRHGVKLMPRSHWVALALGMNLGIDSGQVQVNKTQVARSLYTKNHPDYSTAEIQRKLRNDRWIQGLEVLRMILSVPHTGYLEGSVAIDLNTWTTRSLSCSGPQSYLFLNNNVFLRVPDHQWWWKVALRSSTIFSTMSTFALLGLGKCRSKASGSQ